MPGRGTNERALSLELWPGTALTGALGGTGSRAALAVSDDTGLVQ